MSALQLQWWIIWLQLGALGIAAVVQYKQWHGARGVVMGLMCVLTATLMTQTDVANTQRLVRLLKYVHMPSVTQLLLDANVDSRRCAAAP